MAGVTSLLLLNEQGMGRPSSLRRVREVFSTRCTS
jgi:hypothetical protein